MQKAKEETKKVRYKTSARKRVRPNRLINRAKQIKKK